MFGMYLNASKKSHEILVNVKSDLMDGLTTQLDFIKLLQIVGIRLNLACMAKFGENRILQFCFVRNSLLEQNYDQFYL